MQSQCTDNYTRFYNLYGLQYRTFLRRDTYACLGKLSTTADALFLSKIGIGKSYTTSTKPPYISCLCQLRARKFNVEVEIVSSPALFLPRYPKLRYTPMVIGFVIQSTGTVASTHKAVYVKQTSILREAGDYKIIINHCRRLCQQIYQHYPKDNSVHTYVSYIKADSLECI